MRLSALLLCLCISVAAAAAAAPSYYFGHDGMPYESHDDSMDRLEDPEDYYE